MGFPDFGKKNKGGKKNLPIQLETPQTVKKTINRKAPKGGD